MRVKLLRETPRDALGVYDFGTTPNVGDKVRLGESEWIVKDVTHTPQREGDDGPRMEIVVSKK